MKENVSGCFFSEHSVVVVLVLVLVVLRGCIPDSPKPDSPKLGFRVRVRVSVSANRD